MSKKLALLGGPPIRRTPYPPYNTIGEEEKKRAMEVLDSGVLSGFVASGNDNFYGGACVRELETLFCEAFQTQFAVSFNSATSALHGTMIAAGIDPGDEVLVPPYSMSATASAVLMCNALPVFVDIEPNMFCMDPLKIEAAITPRTKAIIVVNLFGQPADLDAILNIAERHNLILVEDNAQAPAATYKGRYAGTVSHMGVFSLNRHKTMQCGEGGMVITNDKRFKERLQLARNHGEVVLAHWGKKEHSDIVGFNYRLSELHAAVAIPQFKKLDALNNERVALADALSKRLTEVTLMSPPKIRPDCKHVYYLYPMLYKAEEGLSRELFIKAMIAEGMQISNYEIPIYFCPIYQKLMQEGSVEHNRFVKSHMPTPNYAEGICPNVEMLYKKSMLVTNICRSPQTEKEMDEFVAAVKKIEENMEELKNSEMGHV